MELQFEKAEAVIDNPWFEAVKSIAGKIDEKTGKPEALKTTILYPDHTDPESPAVKEYDKLLRLANQAGRELSPPVTVRKAISAPEDVVTEKGRGANKTAVTEQYVTVTFWTVPQQKRSRNTDANGTSPTPETPAPNGSAPEGPVPAAEFSEPVSA